MVRSIMAEQYKITVNEKYVINKGISKTDN